MSVDFKTFVSLAPAVSAAKLPVLLRGRHGIGKSQVVYQLAAQLGLPVIERRASQMTETARASILLIGLRKLVKNPRYSSWMKLIVLR